MSAIATADFRVNGTASNGYKANNLNAHMELQKSCAFQYGNGTCVIMEIEGQRTHFFDTRYDVTLHRDGSNFQEWAFNCLKDYVDSKLVVTRA